MHPEYIAAVRHEGFFRKRIGKNEIIPVENSVDNTGYGRVVDALKMLLNKPEWQACNANIVLSGHFAKFRVARWNQVLSKEEQKAVILHQLEEIYGVDDKKFRVFMSDSGFGKCSLAFAIEDGFYNQLLELEKSKRFTLNSIVPYFVLITNYWRKSISKNAWIIVKDSAYIYLTNIKENSWEMVKVATVKEGWELEVERMLNREIVQLGRNDKGTSVYFHEDMQSNLNLDLFKNISPKIVMLRNVTHKENREKSKFVNYLL